MKKILGLFLLNMIAINLISADSKLFVSRGLYTGQNEIQTKRNWDSLTKNPFPVSVQIQCQAVTPAPGIYIGTIDNPYAQKQQAGGPMIVGGQNPTCSVYLVKTSPQSKK